MAIAEEKVLSANGKVAASPWITVAFEPFTRAPSFAANAWSYSRLVTRAARRRNSSVAAPGPAPSSSTCSPSCEPCKIQGKTWRRVTHRHSRVPQNHVSYRFIESSIEFEGKQFYRDRSKLLKQSANAAKCRSELIGVVSGWTFELLEEGVNGGADFGSIARFCVLAIGNIERIERHDCLFRSAFVEQSDSFRIVRDALQYPQDNGLIVLHGCQSLGDLLRQRRSRGRSRCHRVTIRIQLAHFIQNGPQLTVQFLRVRGVNLLRQQAEDHVT